MIEPPRLADSDFAKLTEYIQQSLEQLEQLPFPKVQEDVFQLLNSLDHLHREALTRLVELIETQAPQLKRQMADDFAIQTLMMLYNFVPPEALPPLPQASPGVTIGLDQIAVMQPADAIRPIWVPAGKRDDIKVGGMLGVRLEEIPVVICRPDVDGDDRLYALDNACLDSILPLDPGRLSGYTLTCPWHDCRYDIRTGAIQNGSGNRLNIYPVRVGEDGRVRVGFNIPEWLQ